MDLKKTLTRIVGAFLRLMAFLLLLLALVYAGKYAYRVGFQVFGRTTPAEEGREVTFTVKDGMDAAEVGEALEESGLIQEKLAFRIQELLSREKGQIQPGTYVLNTAMTAEEVMEALMEGPGAEGETGA